MVAIPAILAALHRRSPQTITYDPPALVPADPDRLELALGLHRLGQAGQGLLVELLAWLVRVAVDLVEGDLRGIPGSG